MLFQIAYRAFVNSLGVIGQSVPMLVFWFLTVVLVAAGVWRRDRSKIAGHLRKMLEAVGIAVLAWLPFFIWSLGYETRVVEAPSVVTFPAIPGPVNQAAPAAQESKDSLRRRTLRLVDKIEAFERKRWTDEWPRYRVANAANVSQDQLMQQFGAENEALFVANGLRAETLGILAELRGKGLDVGYLDGPNGVPIRMPINQEFTDLRCLAYKLDGQDRVQRFYP